MSTPDSDREEILARWVKQPPAPPHKQYFRNIEWHYAVKLMGSNSVALDIANEVTVTGRLSADRIIRADFSKAASRQAELKLGPTVDQFVTINPEQPDLPMKDNTFDGVVSIGPYDHKFLDDDHMTREVKRVLTADGAFVVSIPLRRSPYYSRADLGTKRFYDFQEFEQLVESNDLLIDEVIYLYHPKILFNRYVTNRFLPDWIKWSMTIPCWWISSLITRLKWKNQASFIVARLTQR